MRWWSPVVHAVVGLSILVATVVATGCPTVAQAMPSLPSVLPAVGSWVAVPSGQFAWSSGSRGNLGIYDALYSAGPMLFLIGLLTLTILLVRVHRITNR